MLQCSAVDLVYHLFDVYVGQAVYCCFLCCSFFLFLCCFVQINEINITAVDMPLSVLCNQSNYKMMAIMLLTNALLISARTSSTNFVSSLADKMASSEKCWMVGSNLAGWPSRTIFVAPFAPSFSTRLSTAMFDGAQANT